MKNQLWLVYFCAVFTLAAAQNGPVATATASTASISSLTDRSSWDVVQNIVFPPDNTSEVVYLASLYKLPGGTLALYYTLWTNGYHSGAGNQGVIMAKYGQNLAQIKTNVPTVILSGSGSGFDSASVAGRVELQESGTLTLVYFGMTASGFENTPQGMGLATSTDGTNFVRASSNPIWTCQASTYNSSLIYEGPLVHNPANGLYYIFPAGYNGSYETTGAIVSGSLTGPYFDAIGTTQTAVNALSLGGGTAGTAWSVNDLISIMQWTNNAWLAVGRYVAVPDGIKSALCTWTSTDLLHWSNFCVCATNDFTGLAAIAANEGGLFGPFIYNDAGTPTLLADFETNGAIVLCQPTSKHFTGTVSSLAAPTSFTVPATTVAWTNPYPYPIEIYLSGIGATVSGVKKNGGSFWNFSGTFAQLTLTLLPKEYFSVTYSAGSISGWYSPLQFPNP
jgi:hypothetical protein